MTHNTPRTRRALGALLALGLALTMGMSTASARPDMDGSKMKAKKATATKTIKDSLSAPGDAHDWRYIELDKAGRLTITLKTTPAKAKLTIRVLDGTGKLVKELTKGKEGSYELSFKASPGIYYIDVGIGSGKADYVLTIAR